MKSGDEIPPVIPVIEVMSPLAPEAAAAKLVLAVAASVAPVPPLATFKVPAIVMVPEVVTGPPLVVRPVVPPETSMLVTPPAATVDHANAEPVHFKNVSVTVGATMNELVELPVL